MYIKALVAIPSILALTSLAEPMGPDELEWLLRLELRHVLQPNACLWAQTSGCLTASFVDGQTGHDNRTVDDQSVHTAIKSVIPCLAVPP